MHSESTMLNLHMKKNLMSNRHVENIALLDFKPIAFSFLNLPERFNYYTVRDTRTTEHPISDHVVQLSRTVSLKLNRFHESFDPLFSEKKKTRYNSSENVTMSNGRIPNEARDYTEKKYF